MRGELTLAAAGAGDSVRVRDGRATDDAPFVLGLGTGACRTLGEAILGGLPDGLMEPTVGAGWECVTGLRGGGKVEVAGDA
jgi:hypothetical protein